METLSAIGTFLSAIATLALVYLAWKQVKAVGKQITSASDENRKWRSLQICLRYESDPPITEAVHTYYANKDKDAENRSDKFEGSCVIILNYLDGIATGIVQGIYDEDLIKDYMKFIIQAHTENILHRANDYGFTRIRSAQYNALEELYKKWCVEKPQYKDG